MSNLMLTLISLLILSKHIFANEVLPTNYVLQLGQLTKTINQNVVAGNLCNNTLDSKDNNACLSSRFLNKDVLYIGDSHSNLEKINGSKMGNIVVKQLKECGAQNITYRGVCGSSPSSWMPDSTPTSSCGVTIMGPDKFENLKKGSTENLTILQKKSNPQVVIINLGDNMISWKKKDNLKHATIESKNTVASVVNKLVSTINKNVTCLWIGPAYHSPGKIYSKSNSIVDELYDAIKIGIGSRCTLVDSRSYFKESRPNDGLHFTAPESKHWGEELANVIKNLVP